jgi:hypothetical protein
MATTTWSTSRSWFRAWGHVALELARAGYAAYATSLASAPVGSHLRAEGGGLETGCTSSLDNRCAFRGLTTPLDPFSCGTKIVGQVTRQRVEVIATLLNLRDHIRTGAPLSSMVIKGP